MREVRVRILLMEEKTDQTFLVYIERLDTKIVVNATINLTRVSDHYEDRYST